MVMGNYVAGAGQSEPTLKTPRDPREATLSERLASTADRLRECEGLAIGIVGRLVGVPPKDPGSEHGGPTQPGVAALTMDLQASVGRLHELLLGIHNSL